MECVPGIATPWGEGRGESEVEGLPGRDLVGILELKEKVEEGRGKYLIRILEF